MNKTPTSMTILNMPTWKSKVLNSVAWLLGMRGEYVACITFNFDYKNTNLLKDHACQDCTGNCSVCK